MSSRNIIKITMVIAMVFLQYSAARLRLRHRMFEESDISNEVFVEELETMSGMPRYRRIDYIIESNDIPGTTRQLELSEVTKHMSEKLRKVDPFFIDDLTLKIPSKTIYDSRSFDVSLDQGVVLGMSDFRHLIDESEKSSKDNFHLWLVWNRLRVHYRITANRDGLKNTGSVDADAGRLYMIVHVQKSSSKVPRIQMSKVSDVKVKFNGLDSVSDDLKSAISREIEPRVKNIFNSKVVNILLRCMEETLNKNTEDNMLSSFYSLSR